MKQSGCLDYRNAQGETRADVTSLFYVQSIIRSVETPNGLDKMEIFVNDHNLRTYTFELSTSILHSSNIGTELAKQGIVYDPFWQSAIISHLLYGYQCCVKDQCICYQNSILGWYEFNNRSYYFYDKTDFAGNHAECSRKKLRFRNGNEQEYMKLIRNTVLPSTELSLALAIGYTAVVAARLKDEVDLRNNPSQLLRRVNRW